MGEDCLILVRLDTLVSMVCSLALSYWNLLSLFNLFVLPIHLLEFEAYD